MILTSPLDPQLISRGCGGNVRFIYVLVYFDFSFRVISQFMITSIHVYLEFVKKVKN